MQIKEHSGSTPNGRDPDMTDHCSSNVDYHTWATKLLEICYTDTIITFDCSSPLEDYTKRTQPYAKMAIDLIGDISTGVGRP